MVCPSEVDRGELSVLTLYSRRLLRAFALGVAALACVAIVDRAGMLLLVVFAGALFGVFLSGAARLLLRLLPLPYAVALTLVVLAVAALAVALSLWIVPRAADQIASVLDELPVSISGLIDAQGWRSWLRRLGQVRGGAAREVWQLLGTATGVVSRVLEAAAGVGVACLLGIYGAAQPSVYERGLLRLVPPERRPGAERILNDLVGTLRRWLVGRLVAMLAVGVGTTIAFLILDIPLAFALGLLAGLLTFIEYVGAIASALPAILLALDKGLGTAVWVTVLFTGVHILEGYLITPLVTRRSVKLPPGFTLSVQLIAGALFGIVGLTLATPLSVIGVILVERLWVQGALAARSAATPAPAAPAPGGG
jgi:predicted PurR-regulated permease PerM